MMVSPSWLPWVNVTLSAISLLLFAIVLPMLRYLRQIRQNELHTIQRSLDEIHADVRSIEQKIDRHLQWHSERGG